MVIRFEFCQSRIGGSSKTIYSVRRIPPSAANFLVAQTGKSPIKVIKIGMPVETIVREPKDYQDNGSDSTGAVAIAEPRIDKNHPE